MEKFTHEKFEKLFKKTKAFFPQKVCQTVFENINNTFINQLQLNRVKEVTFSSEKIIYQANLYKIKGDDIFSYMGLYKDSFGNIFEFWLKNRPLMSANRLMEDVKNSYLCGTTDVEEFNDKTFVNKMRQFRTQSKSFIQSELYDATRPLSLIAERKKKLKKREKAVYDEYLYFKHKYIKNLLSDKKDFLFNNFIYRERDPKIIRLEKITLSSHKNETYQVIKEKVESIGEEKFLEFYYKYPVLITLFLRFIKHYPENERVSAAFFLDNYKNNLSFEENVKTFFDLSDEQMQKLSTITWQKHLNLKNRPITAIEMVKKNANFEIVKNRRDALALYIANFYFKNAVYFNPEKDDTNLVKIGINRRDYSKIKDLAETLFNKEQLKLKEKKFNFNKRMDIIETYKAVLFLRNADQYTSIIKNKISLLGVDFKSSKTYFGARITSLCNKYCFDINIDMLNNEELTFEIFDRSKQKDDSFFEKIKFEINETTKKEFSRIGNKRYPTTKILNLRYILDYLIDFHGRSDLKKKKHFFVLNIHKRVVDIIDIKEYVKNNDIKIEDIALIKQNKRDNILDII